MMKKVLAVIISVCMVLSFVPCISFAADSTVNAVRMAYFNSASEWALLDTSNSESGSSCVFVAWDHSDNWNGADTFTDLDGTVTAQSATGGVPFRSSRNAVVSFAIPEDFDTQADCKITLSLNVRYVKQFEAGGRLAIYGNSIDGVWSGSSNKATFGANGADSGLANLPLLGLTTPVSAGGNTHCDETVTLSSLKLTEYVKQMAEEGKTEVTFRIATPYGGAWIYQHDSAYPPTLAIEEGKVTTVNIKTVYMDGEEEIISLRENKTVNSVLVGSTYTYSESITATKALEEGIFVYSEEDSNLSVVADEDGTGEIVIVYKKDSGEFFSGYEIDDEGAWCWFADPRSITYTNEDGTLDFSIIGYIDIHGDIKATQINHLTNEVEEVLIRSNIQPDDHNNPTFLVLPDERIIVFYSRHTDEPCFWYRVTEEPGDLTTLGEEKCLKTSANTTYPSPFILADDPDHIYLCWRGIGWHPTIAKLSMPDEDGNTEFVYGPYQMVNSINCNSNIRPYAKYASNGVDKIYMTYTATHPDNFEHNWYYFNQVNINDMTLEDINGTTMSTIANGPLTVDHSIQSNLIDSTNNIRNWVWQVAIDENGYPVIANVKINGGKTSHDYYYVKWNGEEWVTTFLSNGGGAFHQSTNIGRELCYSGGMAIDPDNTNIIYCSVPVEGAFGKVYEIIKYTMSDDGSEVLATEQITKNSIKNNVRPFVLPNSEGKDIRLIWMNGDYYDWIVSGESPEGYCTSVMAEAPLPTKAVDIDNTYFVEDYENIGGAYVSTAEQSNTVDVALEGKFTVSAEVYLEGSYEGEILDIGEAEIAVETRTTQYGANATGDRARVVVTVGGEEYISSNVYGSSDCWKTYGRGTGGNYGVENYQGYVTLTATYDGEYLTLYREGLVDIKIPAENVAIDNIRVGGLDGMVEEVRVYDRVLNHDEIKALAAVKYEVEEIDSQGDIGIIKNYVTAIGEEIVASETTFLNEGTEDFTFVPVETIKVGDIIYIFDREASSLGCELEDGASVTASYRMTVRGEENLIYNGDMSETTTDGTYTYVTGWQGGYVNSVHNDLSDRPYLYESEAWQSTKDAHFIITKATDDEPAYVTTPTIATMPNPGYGDPTYPWKSDVSEPYMGLVLTSWMKDAADVNSYLMAEKGKTYYMSFEMKATEIASWQNNVLGFDAVTENGDVYKNKIPGSNGDINTLTSVLDTHIGRARYLDTANEWVTVETTATATADGYFMFQLGWAHEWGQTSVRNFIINEYVETEGVSLTAELEGGKLTVVPNNVEAGCIIAVSVNDSEAVFTKVYGGESEVTFTVGETVETIKVFAWKSLSSMEPVCKSLTVK